MAEEKTQATQPPREGGMEAPTRYPLDWHNDEFYDRAALDEEMRRQFDVCHGCRRCFNLCDSFPRLFDLIDESETGELDSVDSKGFPAIEEACTLCDMCFMTKCPYVPPHEFNLDFPHLMLRARAVALHEKGRAPFVQSQLAQMDRNGKLAGTIAPLANWGSKRENHLTRPLMDKALGIDKNATLPQFAGKTFIKRFSENPPTPNPMARNPKTPNPNNQTKQDKKAKPRKAALYATCYVNYNNPETGEAAASVLAHLGVDVSAHYLGCCGMPFLEQGNLAKVAKQARTLAAQLRPLIDEGHDIITLTASCGLMFKFEWPLIVPDDENVQALAAATRDICEYIVDIANKEGLAEGLQPMTQGISVHLACHARAQNVGPKAAELLRLIPDTKLNIIERCAGHGGTFGVLKPTHKIAMKQGKPTARQAAKTNNPMLVSECPLAAKHIVHGIENLNENANQNPNENLPQAAHPVVIFARAYGLCKSKNGDANA
ncbi:MAG: heterodisulfide reductase-related iron-sulfur binding cluster [Alphaproteobacteria bacterium]|nr:heterodisulfide reductase-related iron-sulfur binding cluster [Alphaproteobacteria bacterium]